MLPHQMEVLIEYDGTSSFDTGSNASGSSSSSSSASTNSPSYVEYTIKDGDSPWALAVEYYGDGTRWREINDDPYNDKILTAEEERRGVSKFADGTHWYFTGTTIQIPGIGSVTPTTETVITETPELTNHTVVDGDTLWGLAVKYYGDGAQCPRIYDANTDIIESTAKARGLSSSDSGHWIFSGTVLTIPSTETKTTVKKATGSSTSSRTATQKAQDAKLGERMAAQMTAFTYTDPAYGESDSITITIEDREREWIDSLLPRRGATVHPTIRIRDWNVDKQLDKKFDTGIFTLDDISISGFPIQAKFSGVSKPADESFSTENRTNTWENVTIRQIAQQIADRYNLKLVYEASNIVIDELEQSEQPDGTFLKNLCDQYDIGMKLYVKKLVLYDISNYEAQEPVRTMQAENMLKWSVNTTLYGTYTGVSFKYTDPDDSQNKIEVFVGKKGRVYQINKQASSDGDARLKAQAALNQANRKITTLDVTARGHIHLVAGQCVRIKGIGKFDGKYFIDKAKHNINNGYTCQYTMHRCISEDSIEAASAQKTRSVGDLVNISGIYVSSSSTQKLTPLFDQVLIGRIVAGERNPYQVNNKDSNIAIGWCNDEDIS